nr:unnamed protein product [Spirometra erinaceieuropaei]
MCVVDATAADEEEDDDDGSCGSGGRPLNLSSLSSSEVFPVGRVDLQTLQRGLQSVLVSTDLASLAAEFRGDISITESLGWPLVVHPHEMAASTQLQLSQHGVDAENSLPFQYVGVGDSALPSQIQYPSKTAEVGVIEPPPLLIVDRPGLRSILQRWQDDCLVHLKLRTELEIVTIPYCVFKATEGLTGLGNPAGHFVADFGAAGETAAQIREVVHHLQLGSVCGEMRRVVGCVGLQLVHDNRFLRVDDQVEVSAGGGEEVHAPLHVHFGGGVVGAVVGEGEFVDCGCGYTRLGVHPPVASINMTENIRLERVSARTHYCLTPLVTANASETALLS